MQDYCQVIRDDFQLLDKRDPGQLGDFFVRYKYFSTNDLAQVLSLSSRHIRMLKTRTDIIRTRGVKTQPKSIRIITPDVKLEPGWDCAEWWRHYYQQYGVYILSRISHFSIPTVRKRLRKYNIPTRSRRARPLTHPCCNYEWLYKHYVELNLHLSGCAKAAGVSDDTISSWLNTFKIQVKTKNGPKVGKANNSTALGETACVTVGAD